MLDQFNVRSFSLTPTARLAVFSLIRNCAKVFIASRYFYTCIDDAQLGICEKHSCCSQVFIIHIYIYFIERML